MAETTKIKWVDHTFNLWIGCTRVSPRMAKKLNQPRSQSFLRLR
jgi:protein gp37